ncbi:MAG: DUF423 domain-containing protein [Deltaproteobacteria bacterium]|nr:DUF423 domain-containing protein [Deltaproteobacteria bacterium]
MNGRAQLLVGSVLGFIAVLLGAFGAHALEGRLEPRLMRAFDTGARYQAIHALALVALAAHGPHATERARSWLDRAALGFTAGTVLFSFSLYGLALTGVRALGMITPLGGLSFLAGWVCLFIAALRQNSERHRT